MSKISRDDVLDYERECGAEAAANLLLLAGPDGYDGDYDDYKELESKLEDMKLLEAKVLVVLDDTGETVDISNVSIPVKFKELFIGAHFADMKELNSEVFQAKRCATSKHIFGSLPIERREFVERMQSRKR